MRIGVIAYPLDRPVRGGIDRYVHRLAEHFVADPGAHEFLWIHGAPFAQGSALAGAPEVVLPENGLAAALARRRWSRANPERLDVLFGPYFGVLPGPFKRVVTLHDLYQFESFDVGVAWTLRFRATTRRAARQADWIITGSKASRAQVLRHLAVPEARLALVPYGVDPPSPAPPNPREALRERFGWGGEDPVVLFVGALIARKDPVTLARAFAALRAERANARLLLMGPTLRHSRPILRAVDALGLGASVKVTGPVDDALLSLAYHGSDVFVLPSLFEGFGIPAIEAMGHGLPTILSTGGALAEVAAGAALTFAPGDAAALSGHLERLLGEGSLRAELASRGRSRAAEFSWSRCARETTRVLERAGGEG